MENIKHLLLLLDSASTSFCYYENPSYVSSEHTFMSLETLAVAVKYAERHKLHITLLYGVHQLPTDYNSLIQSVSHTKIVPIEVHRDYPEAIYVINPTALDYIAELEANRDRNLILRVQPEQMPDLPSLVTVLSSRCKRLNVYLLNIEEYTDDLCDAYREMLTTLREQVTSLYFDGKAFELNLLSDRLLLQSMNNCDAGLLHQTVALNGHIYYCPAFYYTDESSSIGDIGTGVVLKNAQLLRRDHAPICMACSAYHCKRCLFLNKQLTKEINTPSHQQCVLSHHEQDASRQLLSAVRALEPFRRLPDIPKVDFLDPYEALLSSNDLNQPPEVNQSPPDPAQLSDRELLLRIYATQQEILKRLS